MMQMDKACIILASVDPAISICHADWRAVDSFRH